MGMAASQARYLGITARKTNVEYEGQQVNQQRTALANESAGLFRRMLSLDAPVAPTQNDYYTDVYEYSDPTSADGNVTVKNIQANGTDPETYTVDVQYTKNIMNYACSNNQEVSLFESDGQLKIQLSNGTIYDLNTTTVTGETLKQLNNTANYPYSEAMSDSDTYYIFENPTNKCTYYINATKAGLDTESTAVQNIALFSTMSGTQSVNETLENVTMGQTDSGIYNSMYWTDSAGNQRNVSLTPAQEYDEQAYNAAMDQYNVDKANYEKEIADINAKTEELQQTDRTLELRLKQLDTEQEALQTELDSVKKVIDKNVENVFKTFQ